MQYDFLHKRVYLGACGWLCFSDEQMAHREVHAVGACCMACGSAVHRHTTVGWHVTAIRTCHAINGVLEACALVVARTQ